MTPADAIAQTRRSLLEMLSIGRAIAIRGERLFGLVRSVAETDYDHGLFEKDLRYLREKGYVRVDPRLSGKRAADDPEQLGPRWYMVAFFELTATGLEIAQKLRSDPALEF